MTRHCTPSASHASQKMRLMSSERLRELVAHVLVPALRVLDAIDVPRAIGVDQSAHELIGVSVDDPLLPRHQRDAALVLAAGAVLREQARPVLPVRRDVERAGVHARLQSGSAPADVLDRERDPPARCSGAAGRTPRAAGRPRAVCGRCSRRRDRRPADRRSWLRADVPVRLRRPRTLTATEWPRGARRQSQIGAAGDPGLALDLAVVQATGDQCRNPLTLLDRTHVPRLPAGSDDTRGGIRTRTP